MRVPEVSPLLRDLGISNIRPDSDGEIQRRPNLSLLQHSHLVFSILVDPAPPITANTLRVTLGPGLPEQEQILTRRRFDIAPTGFSALLIGKDGGEKFRSSQPVTLQKLNEIIDGMPMRQQEMHARSHP